MDKKKINLIDEVAKAEKKLMPFYQKQENIEFLNSKKVL